jgi:hypothetical protein
MTAHNPNRLLDREDLDTRIQAAIDKHKLADQVRWEYTLGGMEAPPDNVQAGATVPVLQVFLGIKNGLIGQPSETAEYIWAVLTLEFNPEDKILDRGVSTSIQWLVTTRSQILNGKGK